MADVRNISTVERLVTSVWVHKKSTGQTMIQVMSPFRQQFGNPSLRKPGKNAHFDRGT
jgi:hypothetical protein